MSSDSPGRIESPDRRRATGGGDAAAVAKAAREGRTARREVRRRPATAEPVDSLVGSPVLADPRRERSIFRTTFEERGSETPRRDAGRRCEDVERANGCGSVREEEQTTFGTTDVSLHILCAATDSAVRRGTPSTVAKEDLGMGIPSAVEVRLGSLARAAETFTNTIVIPGHARRARPRSLRRKFRPLEANTPRFWSLGRLT